MNESWQKTARGRQAFDLEHADTTPVFNRLVDRLKLNRQSTRPLWLIPFLCLSACAALDQRGKTIPINPNANQWDRVSATSELTQEIKYFGFIDVTHDEDGESQYFEAGFFQFDQTAPLSVLLASFRQPESDSCEYYEKKSSEPLDLPDEMDLPGYPYRASQVGDFVEISYDNRRYAKLDYVGLEDQVQYETDVGSLGLTFGGIKLGDALLKTRQLRAHACGDVFPAFSDLPIPSVDHPTGFNLSARDQISSSTKIRWRKGRYSSDEDVRVQIEAGGAGRALFCSVHDDGEFPLPESVTSSLGSATIINPSIYRDAVHFYYADQALLIVSQSSYY